jgi:hypothetical protein
MNGRLENILDKVQSSTGSGLQAELHYLLDRLRRRDRIIGSLTPEQWKSVASRVPPGHRKERDALSRISRLAAPAGVRRGSGARRPGRARLTDLSERTPSNEWRALATRPAL